MVRVLYVVGVLQMLTGLLLLWTVFGTAAAMMASAFVRIGALTTFAAGLAPILTGIVTLGLARVLQVTLELRADLGRPLTPKT